MEIQNILMLIQAFTEHSLTELNVEDGGVKVCLKKDAGTAGVSVLGSGAAIPVPVSGGMTAGLTEVSGIAGVSGIINSAPGTQAAAAAGMAEAGVMAVPGTAGLSGAVPAAGVRSAVEAGLVTGVQPAAGTQLVTGAQPAAGTQLVTGVQPTAGTQIVTGAQPAVGTQLVTGAQPAAGTQLAAGVQPAVGAQLAAGVQLVVGTQAEAVQPIDSGNVVVSPLVGIFYSASSPEAEPFVKVGDRVKKGQVLGIIEAMKLMNEIESEYDGIVEAILVKNEEMVEYGQPLFRIR